MSTASPLSWAEGMSGGTDQMCQVPASIRWTNTLPEQKLYWVLYSGFRRSLPNDVFVSNNAPRSTTPSATVTLFTSFTFMNAFAANGPEGIGVAGRACTGQDSSVTASERSKRRNRSEKFRLSSKSPVLGLTTDS